MTIWFLEVTLSTAYLDGLLRSFDRWSKMTSNFDKKNFTIDSVESSPRTKCFHEIFFAFSHTKIEKIIFFYMTSIHWENALESWFLKFFVTISMEKLQLNYESFHYVGMFVKHYEEFSFFLCSGKSWYIWKTPWHQCYGKIYD